MTNRSSFRPFKPIIYFGVCIDNKDPLGAGRIRAINDVTAGAEHGKLYGDAVEKIKKKDKQAIAKKQYQAWERGKDPYLHNPFLPLHLNVIPNMNEAIKILYYDPENNQQNAEYIGPLTSTPDRLSGDEYRSGRQHTSMGDRVMGQPSVMDNSDSIGVFPNADDIAIQGRFNTDIVLGMSSKLPQPQSGPQPETRGDNNEIAIEPYPQILLRSSKFKPNLEVPSQPGFNDKMTFFQLSTFPSTLTLEEEESTESKKEDAPLSILIEYDVNINDSPGAGSGGSWPPNWSNGADVNSMSFTVYKMPYKATPEGTGKPYMSANFSRDTEVDGLELIYEFKVPAAPFPTKAHQIEFINTQLRNFDTSNWTDFLKPAESIVSNGTWGSAQYNFNFNPVDDMGLGQKMQNQPHPLYYRPGPMLRSFLKGEESTFYQFLPGQYEEIQANVLNYVNAIGLDGVNGEGGGLAFTEQITQRDVKTTETKVKKEKEKYNENEQQGFIVGGAEKIYLFSHNSSDINGKILLDDNYGMNQVELIKTVEKNTSPMVRGDQLMELLELMAQYMMSHTHTYPLKAPCPTCTDGTTTNQQLEQKLQEAKEKMLNKNIRIN